MEFDLFYPIKGLPIPILLGFQKLNNLIDFFSKISHGDVRCAFSVLVFFKVSLNFDSVPVTGYGNEQ